MSNSDGRSISRRTFIRLAGATAAGAVLAACSPSATPTSAPTSAPAATQAPAANTEPAKASPAAAAVTIRFGRHDPVDGDVPTVKTFQEKYPNITVQQEQIADFATKVPALVAAGT